MACFHPLLAYKLDGQVTFKKPYPFAVGFNLPCGQCIGCRLNYSRQWAARCVHEAQMHDQNCFITLTFNPESLAVRAQPENLDLTEFQKFLKRLRKKYNYPVRFFHCGEYGEKNQRPHYHALLFGHDFADKKLYSKKGDYNLYISEDLTKLWPYGFSIIGDLNFETAAYCARYVVKKITGDEAEKHYQHTDLYTGEIYQKNPEYCTMSRGNNRPLDDPTHTRGIGYSWYKKYGKTDCHNFDKIVLSNGLEINPPKYYDKLCDPDRMAEIKKQRQMEQDKPIDKYDERMDRLWIQEEVKTRKIEKMMRNL
jgi:hypothetical protein